VVGDGLYQAIHECWPFDPDDYAQRLSELPSDRLPPNALGM
jgi:hypothetical protein